MNGSQFYYAHNVLGISSLLKPQKIRSTYRLHHSSEKEIDFLFFCQQLNTEKDPSLIQKIAQALGFPNYAIVEIRDKQNPYVPYILNNLLTRFCPKGFVIFGPDLAPHLNPKGFNFYNSEQKPTLEIKKRAKEVKQHSRLNPKGFNFYNSEQKPTLEIKTPQTKYSNNPIVKNLYGQIMKTISINKNQHQSISGCVLDTLSEFTGPDTKKVQETKKQAWKILKQVFPS